jgi:hypothetical protein
MPVSKTTLHLPKARKQKLYQGALATKRNIGDTAMGEAVYREEFRRDIGPDQDEFVDRTESGDEF